MPEPKEKEPLLAELEVVGRVPLTQLECNATVRRSRSWYLCCPNVGDEEISRESSWRYSSLRPVTAPPSAGQTGMNMLVGGAVGAGGGCACSEEVRAVRAEREALSRALCAERQRAASAARAHDARLAELHGVIAELVRRRAHDKHSAAIPEEELTDECESTTQPAGEGEADGEGELDHNLDLDHFRTEQNETCPATSPAELPTPQELKVPPAGDISETSTHVVRSECQTPADVAPPARNCENDAPGGAHGAERGRERGEEDAYNTSLNLSDKDSELALNAHRRWAMVEGGSDGDSCERERGSPQLNPIYAHSDRCESRQAKLACRVRLRRTHETDSNKTRTEDEWCGGGGGGGSVPGAAERLALDVSERAHLTEAMLCARQHDEGACACAEKCARLRAERRVLQCALARAADTAHRLYIACSVHESSSVSLCCALRAADRALETYDVLLALAETSHDSSETHEREAAELVARQLLARLDSEQGTTTMGEPLLSPGPWLQHHNQVCGSGWSSECEARLRAHAARLKADTVALRGTQPSPKLFSYHDIDEAELGSRGGGCSAAEMEAAVALLDALHTAPAPAQRKSTSPPSVRRRPRSRPRHWLHPRASETPL